MSREKLLERLLEPVSALTPEELALVQTLAKADPEVAEALQQCRGMGRLSETAIYGQPKISDAAFLVALRDKLSDQTKVPVVRGSFGTGKVWGAVASACVLVMVVIFAAGGRYAPTISSIQPQDTTALASLAAAIDPVATILPDSIPDAAVQPESLAVYLDVPDMADNWDFSTDSDQVLTDELLNLDPQTLQEVMNDLENTNFF